MPPLLLPPYSQGGGDLFTGPGFISSEVGITPMFEFENSNVPLANRRIPREDFAGGGPGVPGAGQFLVIALWFSADAGQSNVIFPITETFQSWPTGNAGLTQTFTDNSEIGCAIYFRKATGDAEDDCYLDSAGNFFPTAGQGARLGGSPWTGNENFLPVSGDTAENLVDTSGLISEGDLNWGGIPNCLEFVVSVKRATTAEIGISGGAGNPVAGVTKLGECGIANVLVPDRGFIGAWGWKRSDSFNDGIPSGDWNGGLFTSESGSLCRRIRTGLS